MNSDLEQLRTMVGRYDPAGNVVADSHVRSATLERIISTPPPAGGPVRPGRRRRLVTALSVGAAAVAMAVGLPMINSSGGPLANAVERDADGSIKIYIREFTDADGLEQKLRTLGVNAVVDFVPAGMHCTEPRARYAPHDPYLVISEPPRDGASGFMRLHPERIESGRTLVYEVGYFAGPKVRYSYDRARLAIGQVAPCRLVPGGGFRVESKPGN
ncbi:hypothetical protein DP939_33820 [Spongiactinospora rosea]|uniref:Uncharacterized protein n=1 Tax=Spongiactinospora rosea TaxID=2248750 RepID=A0A366LPU9_9ACTN|nr:hypothetical protein [Spongiactinospora rosea]RBQ15670.1 hypothetical protein DP939_33820 [Spongiactinospora rosea]